MLPLEGEAPTGYRVVEGRRRESARGGGARRWGRLLHAADRRFRICAEKGATLPEDDALVVLLRACLRLNAAPSDVDWSASVIPVDDFAAKLAAMAFGNLDGAPSTRRRARPRATWCAGAKCWGVAAAFD